MSALTPLQIADAVEAARMSLEQRRGGKSPTSYDFGYREGVLDTLNEVHRQLHRQRVAALADQDSV